MFDALTMVGLRFDAQKLGHLGTDLVEASSYGHVGWTWELFILLLSPVLKDALLPD